MADTHDDQVQRARDRQEAYNIDVEEASRRGMATKVFREARMGWVHCMEACMRADARGVTTVVARRRTESNRTLWGRAPEGCAYELLALDRPNAEGKGGCARARREGTFTQWVEELLYSMAAQNLFHWTSEDDVDRFLWGLEHSTTIRR